VVYKLYLNNTLFLVPLWYNESYFDNSGCEIIVICEPELPNGIIIDQDNNILIEKYIKHTELFDFINNGSFKVNLGDKEFHILLSNLYMKREQIYKIKINRMISYYED
jgi:hypothetical protein